MPNPDRHPAVIDPEHTWGIYSGDDLLTTIQDANDGEYWAYNHGLAVFNRGARNDLDVTIEPYPDRDRPMLEHVDTCTVCDGKGHDDWSVHACPVDEAGNPVFVDKDGKDTFGYPVDRTRDHEPPTTCGLCAGFGYRGQNGAYKNASALKAAQTRKKARLCTGCNGTGQWVFIPIKQDCRECGGVGRTLKWDPTRPVLPPAVGRCNHATDEFVQDWLRSVTITVIRADRGLTWGESFLGMIGLGSCTDYGDAAKGTDDEVIEKVLDGSFLQSPQFIHMIEKTSRRFGPALVITVTRNGYTVWVYGTNPGHMLGALPPTYFPTVFQEV